MKNTLALVLMLINILVFAPEVNAQLGLKEKLEKHVYTLADDSLKGRKEGSVYSQKAADYIISHFKDIGIPPFNKDGSFLQPFKDNLKNIVGILHGNDTILKDEYIVVGAHYDHLGVKTQNGEEVIYNGADDNASGIAVLIELGRILKQNQSSLKRSVILIAFDAEETGLNGSRYFVNSSGIPSEKIKLMISADMVGWYVKSGYVKYSGTGSINNGHELVLDKNLIPDGLNVTAQKFEKSIFTATDTEPFAKVGIPTLAVTTGLKSPYHKPEDDADLIDYDGMVLITEHLTNIVRTVSEDGDYSASGKIAPKHGNTMRKFSFGVSGNIGSNYHYYTDGALDGKSANSYGIGITSQLNMRSFAIRPEVYYEYRQAKHPAGKIKTHNITIPLNLVFQTTGSSMFCADVFIGGYFSHKFSGKQGRDNLDFTNTFYQNEGGLNFGFDFQFTRIRFGFASRQALSNFTRLKNGDNAHIRNRANYFTLTYIF